MASDQVVNDVEHVHGFYTSSTTVGDGANTSTVNLSNEYDMFIPKWINHETLIPAVIIVHGFQSTRKFHIGLLLLLFFCYCYCFFFIVFSFASIKKYTIFMNLSGTPM